MENNQGGSSAKRVENGVDRLDIEEEQEKYQKRWVQDLKRGLEKKMKIKITYCIYSKKRYHPKRASI